MDEELVLREGFVVDALGAGDVVDREIVLGGQLVQVELGRVDELLMVAAAALRQRDHAELGRPRPRTSAARLLATRDQQSELRTSVSATGPWITVALSLLKFAT